MHIINLKIECKHATGDGTKIVCMNSDYVVRIDTHDCGSFTESPVKKLIVRHDKEYYESTIGIVEEDGKQYLQAALPPIQRQDYVDLGVCGKEVDDPDVTPTYSSTSARFECDKSIICGTVVRKFDPVLSKLDVNANGTYRSIDYGADGFYVVDVDVQPKIEETRTVGLSLAAGNQEIVPSSEDRTLAKVIITKPINLIPANIKKDVNIGDVVGSFETKTMDTEITTNGEHLPPEGYDGFSKVVVNVEDSALPIEVQTPQEMDSLLTSGKVGAIYKYVGSSTNTYESGRLYIIEVVE